MTGTGGGSGWDDYSGDSRASRGPVGSSNSASTEGWEVEPATATPTRSRGNGLTWALGSIAVVLLVALVAFIAYVAGSRGEDPTPASAQGATTSTRSPSPTPGSDRASSAETSAAAAGVAPTSIGCDPDQIATESGIQRKNVNVDRCYGDWALAHVEVPPGEPAGDPSYILSRTSGSWARYISIPSTEKCRDQALRDGMPPELARDLVPCGGDTGRQDQAPQGDLGLSVPMSRPSCDGHGIVVLYSAVTPGAYAQEIGAALARNPGTSYLRTDMSCPSLRQRDDNGNVIYAVYRLSGTNREQVCADVRAAGGNAYGRWLDRTSSPTELITC